MMNLLNQLNLEKIMSQLLNYGKFYIAVDVSNAIQINNIKKLIKTIGDEVNKPTTVIFSDSKVLKVVDYQEFDNTLFVLGKGGTDFCSTFEYIKDELNDNGCCGLVYITDGYGFFPDNQPDYPVAWILVGSSPNENIPFGSKVVLS